MSEAGNSTLRFIHGHSSGASLLQTNPMFEHFVRSLPDNARQRSRQCDGVIRSSSRLHCTLCATQLHIMQHAVHIVQNKCTIYSTSAHCAAHSAHYAAHSAHCAAQLHIVQHTRTDSAKAQLSVLQSLAIATG